MAGYRSRQARARAAFIAKGGVTPTPGPAPTPSPTLSFTGGAVSTSEGDSGTKTVTNTITVVRDGAVGDLVVNLTTAGTATPGVDYVAGPATVTIPANSSTVSYNRTINGDTNVESDETIFEQAVLAAYPTATATRTITIANDDVAIVITRPDAPTLSATPGNSSNTLTVTLAGDGGSAIQSVRYYRGLSPDSLSLIATVPIANGLSYVDANLTNGVPYYYRAAATNAVDESLPSPVVSGQPNGSGLTANQQLLAAVSKSGTGRFAVLGGSRDKGAGNTTVSKNPSGDVTAAELRVQPYGAMTWLQMMGRRIFSKWWYSDVPININSTNMSGFIFAMDGEGLWSSYARLQKLIASDAQVVIIPMSSNSVDFENNDKYGDSLGTPFSAAGYTSLYKELCLDAIKGGKAVIVSDLIERGVYIDPVNGPAISSITFSGTTATVTTATGHGIPSSSSQAYAVDIAGASEAAYNVTRAPVTYISSTQFSYPMRSAPTANASGTITFKRYQPIGGVWGSQSGPRAEVPIINSMMKSWCDAQGIPYIQTADLLTEPQVNWTGTDIVPKADLVRSDMTHWNTRGGYELGKRYDSVLAALGFNQAAWPNASAAGNLFANPTFSGTGGTVPANFEAGSVAPDGVTLSRIGGATAKVTSRMVSDRGFPELEVEVDTATMTPGTQETIGGTLTVPAGVVGNWYEFWLRQRTSAPTGTAYGQSHVRLQTGVNAAVSPMPMSDGGSGVTDLTITFSTTGVQEGPSEQYESLIDSMPSKATSTTLGASFRTGSYRSNTGIMRYRFSSPELRQVADPGLLMYDESVTALPALTSPASYTIPEESPFVAFLTTNVPVQFSLDAADPDSQLFKLGQTGRFRMADIPNFEDPKDADKNNVYQPRIIMTPFNPNVAAQIATPPVTVTNIPDGDIYPFTGADGTDLADLYPDDFTRIGPSGGLVVSGNLIRNGAVGTKSYYVGKKVVAGSASMQGRYSIRTSSGVPCPMFRFVDENNYIYLQQAGGVVRVISRIAGVEGWRAIIATTGITGSGVPGNGAPTGPGLWRALNNGILIWADIDSSGMMRVYQDGYLVCSLSVVGLFDGTGTLGSGGTALPIGDRTGLTNDGSSGTATSTNGIDNWNPRPSIPIVSKVLLKALVLSDEVKAGGENYSGSVSQYTGSPAMSVTTDASGLGFYMDGFNLRSTSPLVSGTTYTVGVTETNPNAVNTGGLRATTFTIIVP